MQSFTSLRRAWPLAIIALAALSACRRDRFADGIGRPDPQRIDTPRLAGAGIVEVVPAGATPMVLIRRPAELDLTGYTLVSSGAATVNVPATTGTDVPVNVGALFEPLAGVANPAQSGEVALLDPVGIVQSYLAWGRDPGARGSSLFVRALQSGAATTGAVVAVPFPRPADSAIVRDGVQTGCFIGGIACPAPVPTLVLREVGPANSPVAASFIEIENVGADAVDITDVRVCHDGECSTVPQTGDDTPVNRTLAAAATLVVCLGPVDADRACPAGGTPLPGSTAIGGDAEVFLAPPGTTTDASALLDYMRTAGGPSTLVSNPLWPGDPAPLGTYVPGESLARNPGPLLPPVWNPARATAGAANPLIDRVTNWETCTEPATAAAPLAPPGASVIVTIASRVDGTITLTNMGAAPVLLGDPSAGVMLTVDDVEVPLFGAPATGLAPSASLTVPASVNDAGKLELRLRAGNVLLQFAQWGTPAPGVTAAVAASLWPREGCLLPRLAVDESLVARDPTLRRGSSGFAVQ